MNNGFNTSAAEYGFLSNLATTPVNGFQYVRTTSAIPGLYGPVWFQKLTLRILFIVHPELRQRKRAAEYAFENRRWRDDLKHWEEETKPESIARHMELTAVDVAALSDEDLLAHASECRTNLIKRFTQHFLYNPPATTPTGDLLDHVERWTDMGASDVSVLLVGSSPASSGWSPQRDAAIAAIGSDPEAGKILASDEKPGVILESLISLPDPTGKAIREYVNLIGYRVVGGVDITSQYALEMPEVIVENLHYVGDTIARLEASMAKSTAERMRALVPEEHRSLFDQLVDEARLTFGLRDERGLYSETLALGVTRRAVIEAGKRLFERGQLTDPELYFEANWEEMQALLNGSGDPSISVLEERRTYRATTTRNDVPQTIGGTPERPMPADRLPGGALRRMVDADDAWRRSIDTNAPVEVEEEGDVLRGSAASSGCVEGTARIVMDVDELYRIEQGDILVTPATTVAYNVILPKIGAIVTDRGGALCHAAIVCREFGIPAVVGTNTATTTIKDGTQIRVDGDTGTVTVL